MPLEARLLDISPDDYHALPGFSSSTAKTLIARSPLHAWTEHGAFGAKGRAPTPSTDRGDVVHALVLGKGKRFAVLDFDDWRTNAAKAARDAARAAKQVPILKHHFDEYQVIASRVRGQLDLRGIRLNGVSEAVIEWDEPTEHGPVRCRAMLDHLLIDAGANRAVIVDLKIVGDAGTDHVQRSAENFGYAIQAAAYRRALTALHPQLAGRVDFLFAFGEAEEPYAMNLCRPDGAFAELGERRWCTAANVWGRCLAENYWPAYGDGVNTISPPAWVLAREGVAA